MTYLEYTTVLPVGAPQPDFSDQPVLQDFIPISLWNRRLELQYRSAQNEEEEHTLRVFKESTDRWFQAIIAHAKRVETIHNVELSSWAVRSTSLTAAHGPTITINHVLDDTEENNLYSLRGAEHLLNDPEALDAIPGWTESSELQRQAVRDAVNSFVRQHRTH